ncbi:cytochrome c oxidase subunit 6b-1 isoform X1 [Capsicum annuum]|uniref:cytochrome c oxidase subunit 6b-1 isoform X1 n=1 Tax=Capsicum annuum TaxID=4072 RepID=UPI0007BF6265|nr:cytochrome c oxidase subunit 6b-1 isoform X1 [Capsicum annuum]
MAEVDGSKIPSLSEILVTLTEASSANDKFRFANCDMSPLPIYEFQYLLKEKEEKSTTVAAVKETEVKTSSTAASEEDTSKTEETPAVENSEVLLAAPKESNGASDSTVPETDEASPSVEAASEESTESTEHDTSGNESQESADETPEIKLETAPADFRFPTTNQTRHCFTRYIEYHRCIAAKGEGAPECDKFAKYYRSLCPGEWIDKWNEQRENGTFPGPL